MIKKIIIILGILLIGVAVGYFGWTGFFKKNPITKTAKTQSITLVDLITSGISQSCTFENNGTVGTFYLANGKIRGEFFSKADNQTSRSFVLADGNNTYLWGEKNTVGVKMPFNSGQGNEEESTIPIGSAVEAERKYNYKCSPWKADEKLFDLPPGVVFQTPPPDTLGKPGEGTGSGTVISTPPGK